MIQKFYSFLATCLPCIFIATSLFISSVANAKPRLAVEPYLGYGQFSYSVNTASDDRPGTVLGGKGGFAVNESTWVALDYHLGGPYRLEKNKNEYLNRMWGLGVGYHTPEKFRVWAGYYFDASLDDIERNVLYKGTAIKISAGVEFQSDVSLNFEYSKQIYTEARWSATSIPMGLDVSVLFVTLSAPLMAH